MTQTEFQKMVLAVLTAQQNALDSLNYAARAESSCGCCSGASPADSEIRKAGEALAALESRVEE